MVHLFSGDVARAVVIGARHTDIPVVIRIVIETGGGPEAATGIETGTAIGTVTGVGLVTRTGEPPETRTGETGTGTVNLKVRCILIAERKFNLTVILHIHWNVYVQKHKRSLTVKEGNFRLFSTRI